MKRISHVEGVCGATIFVFDDDTVDVKAAPASTPAFASYFAEYREAAE